MINIFIEQFKYYPVLELKQATGRYLHYLYNGEIRRAKLQSDNRPYFNPIGVYADTVKVIIPVPVINIPAKELRSRFSNGQIKLNGDPITLDQFKELDLDSAIELGDWLFWKQQEIPTTREVLNCAQMLGYEPEVFADTNMTSLQQLFEEKCILRISKRELYVLEKH